jgi:hypothetical protein
MNGTQAPRPTEPVFAAIEPFWRKAISLWDFYWKMAWHPRLFAEEHLRPPTASSITKAVKHTLWLAGFWSAFQAFIGSFSILLGSSKSESPFGSFGTTLVTVALLALQAIPFAVVLWLLTMRRSAASISQALMVQIYWINIFLASTFVVYTVITAIAAPFQLLVYYIAFLPAVGAY